MLCRIDSLSPVLSSAFILFHTRVFFDCIFIVALHFYCMDELTDEERLEFISLIHKLRSEQRKRLGIDKVYYFYNEDTTHHFHLWMVPRYEWMYQFGNSVESLRPALLHARNNMNDDENMKSVEEGVSMLREGMRDFVSSSR
ncbi:diadenosine tetraphosphate hydrolase [Paenibacillus sp. FSL W8-0919]|uniref:HIT family protein n=1 Tax=Paenibacillus sp. FSL W8-0919 TaxID=2954707 RepID=UPI0030F93358